MHREPEDIPLLHPTSKESTSDQSNASGVAPPTNPFKFGDIGGFWAHVDDITNEEHNELVKELKANLDNLLIFVSKRPPPDVIENAHSLFRAGGAVLGRKFDIHGILFA